MRVGVLYPQIEIGPDAGASREYAQAAEDLGFSHLLVWDHILGHDPKVHDVDGPFTAEHMFHEPLVLLGFLAGVVEKLELVTSILILPQRQTALVAKQAAEIDVLSDGRLRLGVGLGWNDVECEALGVPFRERGRRAEEQIPLLRKLWTEDLVDFDGQFHQLHGVGINPLPKQQPIPIWLGAVEERAVKRAARLADGWFPMEPFDGDWGSTFAKLDAWIEEAGRDRSQFGIEGRIQIETGTPDDWRKQADDWIARGATHLHVDSMEGGLVGAKGHIERIQQAADALADLIAA